MDRDQGAGSGNAFVKTFEIEALKSNAYVRGLAVARVASGKTAFCLTNPIWLEKE